jgi:hypothetical protein
MWLECDKLPLVGDVGLQRGGDRCWLGNSLQRSQSPLREWTRDDP